MIYKLQFAELLPYWNVLLQGLIFTIVLTVVSTVAGIAVGTAGASARTFGPTWLGRRRRRLCRTDPQHAVHRAAVLHLLRPAGARA